MKRALLVLITLTLGLLCHPNEAMLIVTEEWAPYNYSERGKIVGLSTEVVKGIMRIIGVTYPIEMYPSMRAKLLLDTRPHTVLYSMYQTPERLGSYKWVGPIVEGIIYFYKLKGNPLTVASFEDAKRARSIACRRAGLIHDLLVSKGFANLDVTGTDSRQVYGKLLTGRCDLAISDTDIGVKYLFRSMNQDASRIERIPFSVYSAKLYIAFSKDTPDDEVERWEKALGRMKRSGELRRIIDTYAP